MTDGFARVRRSPLRLFFGVYGFLIPLEVYLSPEMHLTIVHVVQALVLFVSGIYVVAGGRRTGGHGRQQLSVLFGGLWILWCTASILWSVDPAATSRAVPRYVLAFGVFFCIQGLTEDRDDVASLAKTLCAGTALMMGYSLWQYTRQDYGPLYAWFSPYYSDLFVARGGLALTGTFANPNILAACGILVLPLLWWRWKTSSGRRRMFWCLVWLALIFVLLNTYSKWCWALLVIVLISLALVRVRALTRFLALATMVGIVAVSVTMRAQIADIVSRAFPEARETSIAPRVALWGAAWKVWQARPFVGYGVNGFAAATSDLRSDPGVAELVRSHNWFAQTAVDLGVIGLTLWLLWFGSLWIHSLRLARWSARQGKVLSIALCVSLATIPLVGVFDDHGDSNQYMNMQWYVAALAVASIRFREERPK